VKVAKAAAKKKTGKPGLIDAAAKLSKVAKIVIFAASVLVLGLAFYALVYLPYSEQAAGLESRINTARNDIVKENDSLKKHKTVGQMAEDIDAAYQYMEKYLPKENEMSQLVQMVSEIASRAGLTDGVTQFKPALPAAVKENYAEIPFTMTLEGEFAKVSAFLYDFSRINRIVNITQVDIGSPKMVDPQREIFHITVKCSGSTYRALTETEIEDQSKASKGKR
jgi:type IV pilus assembly protein PilO